MWFVKTRRTQSVDVNETWIEGGVAPTLNQFDMGDVRAVVLIIDGTRVGDVRVYDEEVMQTVIQRWGTGGGNVPYVLTEDPMAFEPGSIARNAGPAGESELAPTLRANMGDNQPAVRYSITEESDDMNKTETAIPIQDGREIEKKQNGLGVGNTGDPAYTLDTTGAQSVAVGFSHNQGIDIQPTEEGTPTLRAGGAGMSTMTESVVRRLTPTECERLQGFPDGWTGGQSDSQRYRQMGNAVTVNVARAVGSFIMEAANREQT